MTRLKKQTTVLIGIVLLVFVVLIFEKTSFFNKPSINPQPTPTAIQEDTVTIRVDFSRRDPVDNMPYAPAIEVFIIQDSDTAYSLLDKLATERGWTLQAQKYDFGVFVQSIDGSESTADMAWIYFVNGESGNVAADQYQLDRGDIVEWKYIAPSDN